MPSFRSRPAKAILITGAGRGIGSALAIAAAAEGRHVVANYRSDSAEVEQWISALQRGVGIRAEVGIPEDVQRLIDETLAHFGRIDCVINNAGIGEACPIDRLDLALIQKTLHANLTSAFLISQAAWPLMTRMVVGLSSCLRPLPDPAAGFPQPMRLRKSGMEGLMHAHASALRPHRITANAIAPALIESRMANAIDAGPIENLPLGRMGRAEEPGDTDDHRDRISDGSNHPCGRWPIRDVIPLCLPAGRFCSEQRVRAPARLFRRFSRSRGPSHDRA